MQERIYINGVLMEQSDSKGNSLVYQSQLFTDIDSVVSNRTDSVDFPITKNNLLAIDRAHLPGVDSLYAYRRHRVIYVRDGIQIFAGYGTLLSVTDSAIKFSFTWGNVEAFKKLLDIRLRDLQGEPTHVWWGSQYGDREFFDYDIYFGPTDYPHPIVPVSKIIEAMERAGGVKIKNPEVFSDYVIPLVTKDADDETRRTGGVNIVTGSVYGYQPTNGEFAYKFQHCCLVPDTEGDDRDIPGLYVGRGMYDVSSLDEIELFIGAGGWDFSTLWTADGVNRLYMYTNVRIYAVDEDGNYPRELGRIATKEYKREAGYAYFRVDEGSRLRVDVSGCSYITVVVNSCGDHENVKFRDINFLGDSYNIHLYDPNAEHVLPEGQFPIWKNLPDWDCAQLLKNLMKIAGVFPFPGGADNEIEFIGADRIYENRSKAPDWTGKLVFRNGLPTEQTMQFGSYARVNHCRYAEDDTVPGNYDGDLELDSETLDGEADLITLDFAPTKGIGAGGRRPSIASYAKNEEGEVEFTEVTPRILRYYTTADGEKKTTFVGLEWPALLESRYYAYRQLVNRPRAIKASVVLDTLDLSKLDLSVPVYSFSLGHYYAITKLTTKDDGLAEVELLMLHGSVAKRDEVDSISDLTVLPDGNGGYCASIPSMTAERISALRQDPNYRICLIRYGYARRGKFSRYTDRTGKETTTGTDRHKYRNFRGGERWRIIGEELLLTGKISPRSQTFPYYGSTSLVFALNDTITLPPMRSRTKGGKSRNLTKSGRIRNPDRDGIAELSIAMYRRDGNGRWSRISNICPVRGRSEDRRKLWEFSSDNFVEVE